MAVIDSTGPHNWFGVATADIQDTIATFLSSWLVVIGVLTLATLVLPWSYTLLFALVELSLAFGLAGPFAYADREPNDDTELYSVRYRLPVAMRSVVEGSCLVIVDDVDNAGSATGATVAAVRAAGGRPALVAALLRLGETALRHRDIADMPMQTLAVWPNVLWEPVECPDCMVGLPLDEPKVGRVEPA
jgi:orotate phosphoribosyltransferase